MGRVKAAVSVEKDQDFSVLLDCCADPCRTGKTIAHARFGDGDCTRTSCYLCRSIGGTIIHDHDQVDRPFRDFSQEPR